ncbi:MAG: DUF423 domain-containing protein [Candidatus Latescibacteria bacterium]|nr:DUF423 domain-containing protein [Candidatus Latescibacterota bacterium]
MKDRLFLVLGSLSAGLAVVIGAFGGHILKQRLSPEMWTVFEVGARYHFFHALGLLAVAWANGRWPCKWTAAAGWCLVAGTALFSGSLYLLAMTGQSWLGAITPVGGAVFIIGWLCLAMGVRQQ